MSICLVYKNSFGEVVMTGDSGGALRICDMEGFGPVIYDYNTAVFTGYDGWETMSRHAAARHITLSLELNLPDLSQKLRETLLILQECGTLYIIDGGLRRRIRCNQTQIPDVKKILKGEISAFAVQFVCDNPFFEDAEDTIIPLYGRSKCLSTTFTLPAVFGEIVLGGTIENKGSENAEPVISIYYPNALENEESLIVKNLSTGKSVQLDYTPENEDTVIIDIRNRRVTSSKSGNVINYLSDDTFLGDFIFVPGKNIVEISVGDVTGGFSIECRSNNFYREAVIA